MLTALGWALTGWLAYGVHLYFVAPREACSSPSGPSRCRGAWAS
ncbi:hypothetical protein ACFQ0B_02575 [Nonomuraea thailandensis]